MCELDLQALERLASDTGDLAFVRRLIDTCTAMLSGRVDRLVDALVASDVETALDAVLSLRVSSTMVGLTDFVEHARDIEADVRRGDLPGARATGLTLPSSVDAAVETVLEGADRVLGPAPQLATQRAS
ncbi:MAG: hypothetical protein CMH83_16100 [Nocardioides sp.]|nr:hypothetical protein [Nocardioides sp.]